MIIFSFIFLGLVSYFSVSSTVLNSQFISRKLSEYKIYESISNTLIPEIINLTTEEIGKDQQDPMTSQALKALSINFQQNINTQWIKDTINNSYKQITDFLKRKNTNQNMEIDTKPIAEAFSVDNISTTMLSDDFIKEQFLNTKKCDHQVTTNCLPADTTLDEFKNQLTKELDTLNQISPVDSNEDQILIPEKINLYELFNIQDATTNIIKNNLLDMGVKFLQVINNIAYLSILLLALIVFIIIAMFYKEKSIWMNIFGISFIVISIVMILLSSTGIIAPIILNQLGTTDKITITNFFYILIPFFGSIISAINLKIFITAIILLIIAIILLVTSKKYKHITRRDK